MAREVGKNVAIAWVGNDHPHAEANGDGFYVVMSDEDDHTNPTFGKKVKWEPLEEQTGNNPNETQGRWVYASGDDS